MNTIIYIIETLKWSLLVLNQGYILLGCINNTGDPKVGVNDHVRASIYKETLHFNLFWRSFCDYKN